MAGSARTRQGRRPCTLPPFEKGGRKLLFNLSTKQWGKPVEKMWIMGKDGEVWKTRASYPPALWTRKPLCRSGLQHFSTSGLPYCYSY